MQAQLTTTTCIAALFAAIAMTACSPSDEAEAKKAAAEAGAKVSAKVDDAMVTTRVKTELAKDSVLSAMTVDVDTDSGRVSLKGTAASKESREQATALARNVAGVVSVDNQLTVSK